MFFWVLTVRIMTDITIVNRIEIIDIKRQNEVSSGAKRRLLDVSFGGCRLCSDGGDILVTGEEVGRHFHSETMSNYIGVDVSQDFAAAVCSRSCLLLHDGWNEACKLPFSAAQDEETLGLRPGRRVHSNMFFC